MTGDVERVTWDEALTTLEARVEAAESALALADPVGMEPFVAPRVDAPLTPKQAERAQALLTRGEELQGRLEAERDRIRGELNRLPKMPSKPGQSHFEVTA